MRVKDARTAFFSYLAGGFIVALAILMVPKSGLGQTLRFSMTVTFFAGVLIGLSAFFGPLATFLHSRADAVSRDAGDDVRALQHSVASQLDRLLRRLAAPVVALTLCILLYVLSFWPVTAILADVRTALYYAAWAFLIAIPVQAVASTPQIWQVMALMRAAQRQRVLGGWSSAADEEDPEDRLSGPAVSVTGPMSFKAGGFEWTWDDFVRSSITFGVIGSGKTVTVLNALLDGLLSSAGNDRATAASALVLDPKGDYKDKLRFLLERNGRGEDLRVLDPNDPAASVRWNPLDSPDDALEIAGRFAAVLGLMGMKAGNDSYWIESAKTFMRHAIGLLRAAQTPDDPPNFVRVSALLGQPKLLMTEVHLLLLRGLRAASTASPQTDDLHEIGAVYDVMEMLLDGVPDPEERNFLSTRLKQVYFDPTMDPAEAIAMRASRDGTQTSLVPKRLLPGSEAALAVEYFLDTWTNLPANTRSSVQSQLTLMLDPFLREPFRSLFSGKSTASMAEVIDHGLVFLVYMPVEDRPEMSRLINTMIKLDFYRQVLLRVNKKRPSLFFCDEFQTFFTTEEGRGDGPFFSRSRQSFHANVVATQNHGSLTSVASKPDIVANFFGNCAIKIFLRNTDGQTNEWASRDVFGEYGGLVMSTSENSSGQSGRAGLASGGGSISESLQRQRRVPPERFAALTIPDRRENIEYAEAVVQIGSRADVLFKRLFFKVHPLDT